jgi:hypothetical protein
VLQTGETTGIKNHLQFMDSGLQALTIHIWTVSENTDMILSDLTITLFHNLNLIRQKFKSYRLIGQLSDL